ncbi:MAG: hypothetical protein HFI45_11755 [Lachnospiraceae bacterium]|nr:hypothetical protein [Lachnospiraceae bacterium]
MAKWLDRYRASVIVLLVLVCLYGVNITNIYGFSIFPDEFTYWSYAANMAGYDWSGIVSLGSYYSYGYGLVLLPVFILCRDPVIAYRIAVSVNFLFLFLAFIFLVKVMRRLFPEKDIPVEMFSAAAILFPGNLFYAQMAMTEVLLLFLYILAGWLLLDYISRDRKLTLCVLITLLMYSYSVHMRTIGILLSAVGILLFHMLSKRGRRYHIFIMAGLFLLFFLIGHVLKSWAFSSVYGNIGQELIRGNDYGGQIDKIKYIFTDKGIYDAAVSVLGKVLYLGLATYGLFYWGVMAGIREIKKRTAVTVRRKFFAFVILSVLTQILIATVYLLTLGEASDYTYGRYTELIIPFVMVSGAIALWNQKKKGILVFTGGMAAIQAVCALLVARQITATGAETFHGFFMVGISYLYNEGGFDSWGFYRNAYLFSEALTGFVVMTFFYCQSHKKRHCFLTGIVVLELALAMRAAILFLNPLQKAAFRDIRIAEKIEALKDEGRQAVYVYDTFPAYAGILQFLERDMEIQVVGEDGLAAVLKKDMAARNVMIFAFDSGNIQKCKEVFSDSYTYGHFTLLYSD